MIPQGWTTAHVGLGANLGEAARTVELAVFELGHLPHTSVQKVSSLYLTDPVGEPDQPRFVNAVCRLGTGLTPRGLLEWLLSVEDKFGRVRDTGADGPRTLDLDLLLYDMDSIDEPGLAVPHPRMTRRRFVLEPLSEVDPDISIPGYGALGPLLEGCREQGVELLRGPLPVPAHEGPAAGRSGG